MSNKEAAAHNATAPYKSHIEITLRHRRWRNLYTLVSRARLETLYKHLGQEIAQTRILRIGEELLRRLVLLDLALVDEDHA